MGPAFRICGVLLIFGLGACTNGMTAFQHGGNPFTQSINFDAASKAGKTGGTFTDALASEYFALAKKEGETWFDWFDSDFFARKSIKAASGTDEGPEDPRMWRMTPDDLAELEPARARLMSALVEGRSSKPAVAARAQSAYDCWVEEQEEAWQTDQIAACKKTFEAAMAELEAKPVAAPAPAPAPKAPEPIVEKPRNYTVFFDFDSTELTAVGLAVLRQLSEDWGGAGNTLDLIGHTDRSGSDAYNQTLSERRAAAVGDFLQSQGMAASRLDLSGVGESQPDVATADGVREARNRRVVIQVLN